MTYEPDIIISLISRIREKANRFILAELTRHGLKDLKPIHGDILLALFHYGNPTMKELADIVDRKKSTVTTLVDKLVRLEYAIKVQDANDYRVFRISLTQKGRGLKDSLIDISSQLISKVYKDMPKEKRQELVKNLKLINDRW
jgi:DNA-binding MarR family transcriptional regulator